MHYCKGQQHLLPLFFVVLEFEIRVLQLLGRCYLNHASSPFFCSYFGKRVFLFVQTGLDHGPPIFILPAIARMTGVHHSNQLLVEMGSHKLFVQAGFKT
jgi:hypothetical protein